MSETNNSNEVVVSIKNLQKAFGDNVVLRDIDLDVHKGEVVVVLGPSGSGKSTMLRCINRLEEPTSGSIVVEGVDVCAKGVDLNKVRTHLGMVFQQFNLFENMNVQRNLTVAPMR
ncbi:MAG: ATP-binding cassette domain-containing protein, partial [Collinsella sp.]|nr:ATP-binding cassette domain-containing protein [Collinsella sp.]